MERVVVENASMLAVSEASWVSLERAESGGRGGCAGVTGVSVGSWDGSGGWTGPVVAIIGGAASPRTKPFGSGLPVDGGGFLDTTGCVFGAFGSLDRSSA